MTAAARNEPGSQPHPLVRGASPAVVRRWLFPHDADRFLIEYRAALDEARISLDLEPVLEVVERWRQIAVLQTDPAAYRRTLRRAAELATGEPSPDDEPLEVTSARAGL
jgi:hypothetical protein